MNECKTIAMAFGVDYFHCENCGLRFRDPAKNLSGDDEKERYLTHQNSIENEGYVKFLNRAIKPALNFIAPSSNGLDFGSGPGPTLAILMERLGFNCDNYDPFFAPTLDLTKSYDFIFATESAEHFYKPQETFVLIDSLLKSGGHLILMTELYDTIKKFETWYYLKDPTHVALFCMKTIAHICEVFNYQLVYTDKSRVIIVHKL